MIPYIETEWVTEPPNDIVRRQNEGLRINPILAIENWGISDFLHEERNSQENMTFMSLSVPGSSSPFSNFKRQFSNIEKDLWHTLPEDSSERVDEYI